MSDTLFDRFESSLIKIVKNNGVYIEIGFFAIIGTTLITLFSFIAEILNTNQDMASEFSITLRRYGALFLSFLVVVVPIRVMASTLENPKLCFFWIALMFITLASYFFISEGLLENLCACVLLSGENNNA